MNEPLLERRQEPRCAQAQPLTVDELQVMFDHHIERSGGAHGSEQARAMYLAMPALSQSFLRRERRDRRWLMVSLTILAGGCAAAFFQPAWIVL